MRRFVYKGSLRMLGQTSSTKLEQTQWQFQELHWANCHGRSWCIQ
jgi:3-oxoacyl-[acyl-carrier-protein] synthase III